MSNQSSKSNHNPEVYQKSDWEIARKNAIKKGELIKQLRKQVTEQKKALEYYEQRHASQQHFVSSKLIADGVSIELPVSDNDESFILNQQLLDFAREMATKQKTIRYEIDEGSLLQCLSVALVIVLVSIIGITLADGVKMEAATRYNRQQIEQKE